MPPFDLLVKMGRLKNQNNPRIELLHETSQSRPFYSRCTMIELLNSLQELVFAVWNVITAIGQLAINHWFLLAWIAYFLFAVHWAKAFDVFSKGGWVAASLVSVAVISLLSTVSNIGSSQTAVFGWKVNSVAGTVASSMVYLAIAFVCGSIQMSGLPGKVLDWFQRRVQNIA